MTDTSREAVERLPAMVRRARGIMSMALWTEMVQAANGRLQESLPAEAAEVLREHMEDYAALLARAEAAEARADAAERDRNEADNALVDRYRNPQSGRFNFPADVAAIVRRLDAAESALAAEKARSARLVEALRWYEPRVTACRKFGREGDIARQELNDDGGAVARTALTQKDRTDGE